jgi:GNAT superfamily N-acetyltransferase
MMKVLQYFEVDNKEHWLSEIAKSNWDAAHYLHYLLKENKLDELVGEGARVLLLVDGDRLVSFCTLAKYDDVQPTDLTPWVGWVYTFPEYRGNRLSGLLISHAEEVAKCDGAKAVHISTNHVGLYEKFGYEFFINAKDVEGEDTRVYRKNLI